MILITVGMSIGESPISFKNSVRFMIEYNELISFYAIVILIFFDESQSLVPEFSISS